MGEDLFEPEPTEHSVTDQKVSDAMLVDEYDGSDSIGISDSPFSSANAYNQAHTNMAFINDVAQLFETGQHATCSASFFPHQNGVISNMPIKDETC